MKNMKKLLSVMTALGFTTVAAVNVVACSNGTKSAPQLNADWAKALGIYNADGTSKVSTSIGAVGTNATFIANVDTHAGTFNVLLNSDKKAKDAASAAFLSDLGFKSGNVDTAYSPEEQTKIGNLVVQGGQSSIKAADVTADGTTDFKAPGGTGKINIGTLDDGDILTTIKSYTINTIAGDMQVPEGMTIVLGDPTQLTSPVDLTGSNFLQSKTVSQFALKFKTDEISAAIQKGWDAIISLLNKGAISYTFKDAGTPLAGTAKFPNKDVTMTITLGGVDIVKDLNMGTAAA